MGYMIYFQFCTLGLQQKRISQQHVAGMYKACRHLHQPAVAEATVVAGSAELGAAVPFADAGLSCIMIIILSSLKRS